MSASTTDRSFGNRRAQHSMKSRNAGGASSASYSSSTSNSLSDVAASRYPHNFTQSRFVLVTFRTSAESFINNACAPSVGVTRARTVSNRPGVSARCRTASNRSFNASRFNNGRLNHVSNNFFPPEVTTESR